MAKRTRFYLPGEPLLHPDHRRPVSRREFIAQGFRAGTASVIGLSTASLLAASRVNALDANMDDYLTMTSCNLGAGIRKIPFICFDLAGGANIAGSNVLVGGPGGQTDSLDTAGYSKLGLPPDILPDRPNPGSSSNNFINEQLGLKFHSESAMLRGILSRVGGALGNVDGAVIPARSDNDTGNNEHNPMYGIYQAGLRGGVLQLIGSNASISGGNSMAYPGPDPITQLWIDPEIRPTKIDRPSDASGLVDVGDLGKLLTKTSDIVSVMETIKRISDFKLSLVNTARTTPTNIDRKLRERVSCEYKRAAETFETYPDASSVDPTKDPKIIGSGGNDPIFTSLELSNTSSRANREYQKTASVMKLVIDGLAGAGTITMGGYDYHTGDRSTGEARDELAGECIGACLAYAAAKGTPVMIYVCSDGSVFSNGTVETVNNVPKGVWTGDNSSTAASFFLVYDPYARPTPLDQGAPDPRQIGWMRSDGSVETSATPAADNVGGLVQTVILNYMALHGEENSATYNNLLGDRLGDPEARKRYIAFTKLNSVQPDGSILVKT